LFNTTNNGFNKTGTKEKNIFRNTFELIDGTNRMNKIFDYLHIQQNQTDQEKNIVHRISISICRLFKSDTPPSSFKNVLLYINNLKSSPSPSSGFDFPSSARNSWNGMINADECVEK
jgi:hypothetical protein